MNRKAKVLKYIKAHPGCTKTKVKNSNPFAFATTDKILKELIELEEKVIHRIDNKNPRIHHLFFNDEDRYARISSLMGPLTCTQLITRDGKLGETICCPTITDDGRRRFPMPTIVSLNALEAVKDVLVSAKWY